MMVLLRLCVLAVVFYAQMDTAVSAPSEDRTVWSMENWQDDPEDSGLTLHFTDLLKRSKSQQFHGLMGRSSGLSQPQRLGNKGEMFVGLMGRRSSNGDTQEELEKPQSYYADHINS
ncbi:tachykinin-4 isoform X2 [Colossoma macropomum]|uniref:tachykinin-4 isoform X2 n=1 Tax=Colossoma macropomum TaxID=42526 RepID=UPI001863BB01|nr:tachykinin-4 isoform X2 [Colossoma macropomum]